MDDILTDKELAAEERQLRIENEDKKEDAQRAMAWYALAGMILYPVIILISELIGMSNTAKILGDMAGTYFMSTAGIVAAFFVKEGYVKANSNNV